VPLIKKYKKIIADLKKENARLEEESALVWDMCNELRASEISFNDELQNMLKSVQEDAFYHAWIKKVVDVNEETKDESNSG
jgi:peptidoglycan hydrolase CwlO-like protein